MAYIILTSAKTSEPVAISTDLTINYVIPLKDLGFPITDMPENCTVIAVHQPGCSRHFYVKESVGYVVKALRNPQIAEQPTSIIKNWFRSRDHWSNLREPLF